MDTVMSPREIEIHTASLAGSDLVSFNDESGGNLNENNASMDAIAKTDEKHLRIKDTMPMQIKKSMIMMCCMSMRTREKMAKEQERERRSVSPYLDVHVLCYRPTVLVACFLL